MKKKNIIAEKSFTFALRIIKLQQFLLDEKNEFILSKQILRSGNSICANVEEAICGQSEKDFKSKLSIAYKEARETHYWLRLLNKSGYIADNIAQSLLDECEKILKICVALSTN